MSAQKASPQQGSRW